MYFERGAEDMFIVEVKSHWESITKYNPDSNRTGTVSNVNKKTECEDLQIS